MKRLWLVTLAGVTGLLTAALIALSGCGGGGGPIVQPGGGGGGGGASAAFLQLIKDNAPNAVNATYVGSDKCLQCHGDTYHANWKKTMHFNKNVGCENCHGPGSAHVSGRAVTLVKTGQRSREGDRKDILKMPAIEDPTVCGQCHGPIHDQFESSAHAEVVSDPVEEAVSNRAVFGDCVRCHASALRTQMINAPWTKGLLAGVPVSKIQDDTDTAYKALDDTTFKEFVEASHNTANCVTCHDPHTPTGMVADEEAIDLQVRRATFNTDPSSTNGAPTKIHTNWNHVCGTCHNGRTGTAAGAVTATTRPNFHEGPQYNMLSGVTGVLSDGAVVQNSSHFKAPDQCVHCHMPNASHTFKVNLDTSCQPCHSTADAAARAASVRDETLGKLLELKTKMEAWSQKTYGVIWKWDYVALVFPDSTSQDYKDFLALQPQIPVEIKKARHNYYFVKRDASLGIHNTPYTRQLLKYATDLVDGLLGPNNRSVKIMKSLKQFRQELQQSRVRDRISERHIQPNET